MYNEDKNTISLFTHALLDKPIYCIYEDRFNDLWFGTFDAGIFKLSRKESLRTDVYNAKFTHYLHSVTDTTSLLSNRIWSIYEDSESNLWIGTFLSLEKFDRENENFTHYLTNSVSNSETNQYEVNTIFESKNGQLWLGTSGGGLATFDKNTETINYCKTPKEVYGIIEDEKGYLWLSTATNGICKYNTRTKTFQIFNSFDGLQGEAFERKAFGKLDKGNLIFGGIKGVNIFHPDSIIENNYIPPIVITDFKLFNKSVARLSKSDDRFKSHFSELKSIELSYKENVFAIEFSALDFLSPSNDKYAYKLEGFDKDWIYTDSENNSATYTNLDGGKYTFKVKGSNSNNLWNEEATELKITVHPPYWKKWWFRLLITLLITNIAIAIIRNRLKSYKIQKLELERLVRSKTSELTHQKEKLEQSNIELQKQKEEIISQRDNLKELANQVEEANFRKMRFFTNISHELRTPLTLLISPINRLLKSEKLDGKINDDLQLMRRNGLRLQKLVNQLMDFRKIETGTMPLLVSQNNIAVFIKNIKETFDGIANQYSINYTFTSEFSDINCWFDSDKVEKIVYNLLSNAFKYTQINGTITVNISILNIIEIHSTYAQYLVEKGINPVGEAVEIVVADTGRGIADDKLEKIFNRFYQIENVKAGLQEGTGIGLALAKDLIDLHKGEISVSSELGKGTNFKVKLPVSESFFIENGMKEALNYEPDTLELKSVLITEDFQKTGFEQPEISKETSPFNQKILIVEDNVDLRQFLKSCFIDNYTVIEAGNGGEGIEKALKNQPDLILSDVMMPVINGMEMCLRLKQNIETSHIPVILLTARTLLEHQLEGLETGADDYITKPFESEILQLKVRNMIETRTKLAKSFSSNVAVEPNEISVSAVDAEFIEKAIEIINKNMANEDFNVEVFTQEIGMGRTLFFNKIRKLTNLSVNEFIQTVRLKKAIQLMTESNIRVSEVCYDTGFSNPRYFATCFKKQFGKTPTEYLNDVRKHK
jgi:signal transduction histidine kinase/CheY-like chemotaxis protein/AraC-like DNA-binding protein